MTTKKKTARKHRNPRSDGRDEVRAYFMPKMGKAVQSQLQGAMWDLYEGPMSRADAIAQGIRGWKGFSHAVDVLNDWADRHLETVYFDHDSGSIATSLDEGYWSGKGKNREWIESDNSSYQKFDVADVKRAVFGRELARVM